METRNSLQTKGLRLTLGLRCDTIKIVKACRNLQQRCARFDLCLIYAVMTSHALGPHRSDREQACDAQAYGSSLNVQRSDTVSSTPPQPIETPLTADELARSLPLHPETIRKWARQGQIPCVHLGPRRVVFLPSRIRAWLESRHGYTGSAGRAAPTFESEAA